MGGLLKSRDQGPSLPALNPVLGSRRVTPRVFQESLWAIIVLPGCCVIFQQATVEAGSFHPSPLLCIHMSLSIALWCCEHFPSFELCHWDEFPGSREELDTGSALRISATCLQW